MTSELHWRWCGTSWTSNVSRSAVRAGLADAQDRVDAGRIPFVRDQNPSTRQQRRAMNHDGCTAVPYRGVSRTPRSTCRGGFVGVVACDFADVVEKLRDGELCRVGKTVHSSAQSIIDGDEVAVEFLDGRGGDLDLCGT